MKYRLSLLALLSLGASINNTAMAANLSIDGTITDTVYLRTHGLKSTNADDTQKQITFQRIVLSDAAKSYLANHVDGFLKNARFKSNLKSTIPDESFVGMNGVPVLDQGRHGTCVTFAVTAAMDAAFDAKKPGGSSDYYSQLCSLELGTTLEEQSPIDPTTHQHTYYSGWDGSFGSMVIDQVATYGLVPKDYQESKGCAGVTKYPKLGFNHGKAMSINEYKKHSEAIIPPISYNLILKDDEAFSSKADMEEVLASVKKALASKHLVTFGTLLDTDQGHNGALGSYKVPNDTWILTDAIAADAKAGTIQAGHEMVIIGYDDNAEVTGPNNDVHKGVLTLRNSWSDKAGDQGNYYMTYDHFKALADEAAEIIPAK